MFILVYKIVKPVAILNTNQIYFNESQKLI